MNKMSLFPAIPKIARVAADNAAAVVTIAAVPQAQHVITGIYTSYDGAGAAAGDRKVAVAAGGTTYFDLQVNLVGPTTALEVERHGIVIPINTAVTITLSASGTSGIVGDVNVRYL